MNKSFRGVLKSTVYKHWFSQMIGHLFTTMHWTLNITLLKTSSNYEWAITNKSIRIEYYYHVCSYIVSPISLKNKSLVHQ